ncbi:MAG: hemolysin family protein [Egibacteraceae bacterium]
MSVTLGLLIVLALIAANAWFVAGEFAYVTAHRKRLEELADSGDARAKRALSVLGRLSFMLSGAQLGITVSSLALGFVTEQTLGRALRPLLLGLGVAPSAATGLSLTLGLVVATVTQMIFGELAPKNLAIAIPNPTALRLARSTWLYLRVAGPVIAFFDNATNGLLRLVGVEPIEELEGGVSPEELELIISESERKGALPESQATLLTRALEFRELDAADAMVPRPQAVTIEGDATCDELRALASESGHSRFPVVAGDLDEVQGIVEVKEILRVARAQRAVTTVDQLMTPPLAVPESTSLGPLLTKLRTASSQLALVLDEFGDVAGLVTLEDIVEELVGEIHDEYDPQEPAPRTEPDGSIVLPGSWRLDETERDTGIALPRGQYETLSGLMMQWLGRLPRVGDAVTVDGVALEVTELDGMAVGRLRLRLPRRRRGGARRSDQKARP